jgi:hypothetical protein
MYELQFDPILPLLFSILLRFFIAADRLRKRIYGEFMVITVMMGIGLGNCWWEGRLIIVLHNS